MILSKDFKQDRKRYRINYKLASNETEYKVGHHLDHMYAHKYDSDESFYDSDSGTDDYQTEN